MGKVRRRTFIVTAGLLLTAPFASIAQERRKVWRVGFLASAAASATPKTYSAFSQGMRDLGYIEGQNLNIEWHITNGRLESLSAAANELARRNVEVIVTAGGTRAARAARQATSTIPIVFTGVGDPVRAGFAASLAKPGGNLTGITNMAGDLELKRFELLREMVPHLNRVAYLSNPDVSESLVDKLEMRAALNRIGLDVLWLNARSSEEIDSAFNEMVRSNVHGVIFATENSLHLQVPKLVALATKYRLPAAMGFPDAAEAGLLASYGSSGTINSRQASVYVDKILKGAKPGDLAIEQPKTFELVVNLKTANALRIKIPTSVMVRADRVIE